MKKTAILLIGIVATLTGYSQDQIVNGTLTTTKSISVGEHVPDKIGLGAKLHFRGNANNSDHFWIAKNVRIDDESDLLVNIADYTGNDRFVITSDYFDYLKELFVVTSQDNGRVGIGVSQPTSTLDVNGTIRAKEVKIEVTGWADFVFQPGYQLKPLSEVENHIKEYKHLPDIPSEGEVKENGISVGEMQTKLLQKIEELTLYVIEQQKEIKELKDELINLKNK